MPKIYLYAEVLTHLRQLTLHASLETEKNEETKIDISSDKKIITVIHDGESSSLYLPTQISGTAQVTFPLDKKTEISARVQIEDVEQWKETDAAGIEAPWIASELSFETAMSCIDCEFNIVPMGTISTWKDLPNQHWADIMDLWFCHKPHEHHDSADETKAAEAKGFSAHSKILSEPGIGLVDLVSFALHPEDCNIIKTDSQTNQTSLKHLPVHCPQCRRHIGVLSPNENLARLDKSSLSLRPKRNAPNISYPPTAFISAQLLELIESTAIRKVIVYDDQPSESSTTLAKEEENLAEDGISQTPSGNGSEPHETTSVKLQPESDQGSEQRNQAEADSQTKPTTSELRKPASHSQDATMLESEAQSLLLWIFNPDIYYSSSRLTTKLPKDSKSKLETDDTTTTSINNTLDTNSVSSNPTTPPTNSPSQPSSSTTPPPQSILSSSQPAHTITTLLPHRALKIFYQPIPTSSLPEYLHSTTLATQYEPLPLPSSTLKSLHNSLTISTSMLPATARNFNEWHVGLLDRYERHPTAEKVMENNPLARKLAGEDIAADGLPRVTRWEMPAGAAELYL